MEKEKSHFQLPLTVQVGEGKYPAPGTSHHLSPLEGGRGCREEQLKAMPWGSGLTNAETTGWQNLLLLKPLHHIAEG